jgi:hypothetical protein
LFEVSFDFLITFCTIFCQTTYNKSVNKEGLQNVCFHVLRAGWREGPGIHCEVYKLSPNVWSLYILLSALSYSFGYRAFIQRKKPLFSKNLGGWKQILTSWIFRKEEEILDLATLHRRCPLLSTVSWASRTWDSSLFSLS